MNLFRWFVWLGAVGVLCLTQASFAQLTKPAMPATGIAKVALVIGNSKYQRGELENPVNDASDVAAVLQSYGFDVVKVLNADRQKMRESIRQFGEMLGPKTVAVLFYAGHGLQINGKNYLIPVDANIKGAEDAEDQGVSLDGIMQRVESRKPRFNIVILDACRNNPFARSYGGGGLASVDAPAGSLVAFATGPSKVAADGSGRNGLYTSHLLRHINTPNLKIEEIFKRVRMGVMEQSAGDQVPWENTSLTEDFILNAQALAASVSAAAPSDIAWVASASYEQLKSYLASHPTDINRDQVTLAFARANAAKPLRKEALKLAIKECEQCPKLTELAGAPGQKKRYIGTDLITVEEYQRCVAAGACRDVKAAGAGKPIGSILPINNVSLNDSVQYVAWVNKFGRSRRYYIPSQQEWMDVFHSGYFLPSGVALASSKSLCDIGNFYDISGAVSSAFPWSPNTCNDGFPVISPVGTFMPSLDGVFDLVGNLWQWTTSCQASEPTVVGTKCTKSRLVGGSWATAPRWNWKIPPEIASEPELATDLFGIRVMAQDL
jgi:uncharacterized caspase-like protein